MPVKEKMFKVRLKVGLHNDGKRTYSPDDGWFLSKVNLVEVHGNEKFELFNPEGATAIPDSTLQNTDAAE